MANNRICKERLSQNKMAASYMVQIHTHVRYPRSKKWPTYHVAVPIGNTLASQQSIFRENCLKFQPSSSAEKVSIICSMNNHMKSEILSNRHTHTHTQTHRPSTVTLAAHARRGLNMVLNPVDCSVSLHNEKTYPLMLANEPNYRIVPGKRQTPNSDSSVVKVLCVTVHHTKFLHLLSSHT